MSLDEIERILIQYGIAIGLAVISTVTPKKTVGMRQSRTCYRSSQITIEQQPLRILGNVSIFGRIRKI
jgi:hypothetical protein